MRGVALFGNALHVAVADEGTARTAIPEALAARGGALRRLERIEPSLEDAFVAIIETSAARADDARHASTRGAVCGAPGIT